VHGKDVAGSVPGLFEYPCRPKLDSDLWGGTPDCVRRPTTMDIPFTYKGEDLILVALAMAYGCERLLLMGWVKAPQTNAVICGTGRQDARIGG
jgi:hypothetical protein